MAAVEQYNLFKPVGIRPMTYDTSKSIEENVAFGNAANVKPQTQVKQQQQTQPVIDGNSSTAGMDYLNSLYTSPQEEERLRKASVMNQRILAISDAIRHIGNIANTVNYAPAQQLNSPVQEEQARYERGKAMRDRANQTYLAYQQQKAAQDAKARQWAAEQKQKADQWNATFKFNAAKAAADLAERQRQYEQTAEFNREKQKANEARWERQDADTAKHRRTMEGIAGMNARTNRERASAYINHLRSGGGNGGKEERRDTRRGYLTKRGATAGEIEATYHQMYEWGKKMKDPRTGKPYIDENALKGQMTYGTYSFGGSSTISQDLKERAVNQMLMEHDDAAVRMHSKYGWDWHEQKPNDKKMDYSQYVVQPSGSNSNSNSVDYSKYIRK